MQASYGTNNRFGNVTDFNPYFGTDYGICSIIKPQLAFDSNLDNVPYWEKIFGKYNWNVTKGTRVVREKSSRFFFVWMLNICWEHYTYKRKILAVMHKFQNKTIPEAFHDHFKDRLSHSRDGCSLKIPRILRKIGRTSVIYRGTFLWSTVSLETRNSCSLQQFKNKIQRDRKLITLLSFRKEACLIRNKKEDFEYF